MKNLLKFVIPILILLVISGIFLYIYGPNFSIYILPPSPQSYGKISLKQMNNGLYATGEEWIQAKDQAETQLKKAKSYEEVHPILEEALQVAGGKHSFILGPGERSQIQGSFEAPEIRLEDGILYIKLPPVLTQSQQNLQDYADRIHEALQKENYLGLIIDLSDNTGGDAGPMLAGLSSLFPDGQILHYKYSNGGTRPVTLENGKVQGAGTTTQVRAGNKIENLPIALIFNGSTASSGELTALAFSGLDQVRTFGQATAAYTSANLQVNLYDGAVMQLTVASLVDRTGTEYKDDPILPHAESKNPMKEAKDWILQAVTPKAS